MSGETGSFEVRVCAFADTPALGREQHMSTTAVTRTFAVLIATLLAVVAGYTVFSRSAKAAVRPASTTSVTTNDDPGKSHAPVIASGVKFVRNADGSVSQTR